MLPVDSFALLTLGRRVAGFIGLRSLRGNAEWFGTAVGPFAMPAKAAQLRSHLEKVDASLGDDELDRAVAAGFGSYARYWVESLRLDKLDNATIDRGFSVDGFGNIASVLEAGHAPVLVLPHLGGWEWAAAWLHRALGLSVSAVVESLEPREVFDWFVELRESYGINVIELGPSAFAELRAAVNRRDVVCLLADRDIADTGVEVEFFGEVTKLPAGPATLSLRTGSPLLPTAVYFRDDQIFAIVRPPIWPNSIEPDLDDEAGKASSPPGAEEQGRRISFKHKITWLTKRVAGELETLIALAPDQWHLLEPNWPSDFAPHSDRSR